MKTSQTLLIDLITEYHRLYAQFKRPVYLEIAAGLGKAVENWKNSPGYALEESLLNLTK